MGKLAQRSGERFSTDNLVRQLVELEPARAEFEAEAVATRPQFENQVLVWVKLLVKRIYSVDQKAQRFTMVMEVFQRWRDCRLIHKKGDSVVVTQDSPQFPKIWKPSVSFEEEVFTPETSTRSRLIIDGDGSVLQASRMSRAFSCSFNFGALPWDTQHCQVHLTVPEYTADSVRLIWDPGEPLVVDKLSNKEWRFPDQAAWSSSLDAPTLASEQPGPQRSISALSFSFDMERKPHDYELNYVAPALVYWLCSYGSFYVDPGAVPARVTLGLIPVLTLNNKMGQLRSSLPPINETFRLETFMFIVFILTIVQFLEYCIVNFSRSVKEMTAELPGPVDVDATRASWRKGKPYINRCAACSQANLDLHSRWFFPLALFIGMMITFH